ncbi:MAG: hypothetical protein ACJ8DJ_03360 [Gemmatimonadales bacterium]
MRPLRGVAAALLWVLASVLTLVAVLLCITVILLPVGIAVLFLAVRLYKQSIQLLLPRKKDIQRGVREGLRVGELRSALDGIDQAARDAAKGLKNRLRRPLRSRGPRAWLRKRRWPRRR